ncbi:MAG: dihydropteroate synthase [Elusimicrobiota bacterium]|jgi:dihydropteroate synthase
MSTAAAERLLPSPERLGRPLIIGVVNATPDSFHAPSRVPALEDAVALGLRLVGEGADLLDVGGESTRPGSAAVSVDEELRRVLPILEALAKKTSVPLSVDTSKAAVALRALECGASVLNDVTALRGDPRMTEAALRYPVVLLMHMQGTPRTMQEAPAYRDVVAEVRDFLSERLLSFVRAGGDPARVWLDPGIGFGKALEHNLELFRRLEEFAPLGRPLVVGASRKAFIGRLTGTPEAPLPSELRLEGSLAAACRAAAAGAHAVRVHDVAATRRALEVYCRLLPGRGGRA